MMLTTPVTDRDHSRGPTNAPVTIVEYADFQCPYSGQAHKQVAELLRALGNQVRFVFRPFPLVDLHPEALPAACVAEFAGEHGKYWEMYDILFDNQMALGSSLYIDATHSLGLDSDAMVEAVNSGRYIEDIQAVEKGGRASGVQQVPTFFFNGHKHEGGHSVPELLAAIEAVHRQDA